ncbi:hybrid sensor histidine kinase/response regulator [Aspergillus undulatus]|uniref:hybrid sensor histidine kinase/response regulator n=1 Tax=Aspergillus undulatus TaxID=1810928 RepID=UPI003CCDCBEA
MSVGCYRQSACDAERERLREVARYYCLIDRLSSNNDTQPLQGDDRPDHNKRLASDAALTGLARLGVLQLGCNRAFVSIIDEANEHIIAEATKSISLHDASKHQLNDGLYLGVKSLGLGWGVVPHTIGFFTNRIQAATVGRGNVVANDRRYIVHDLAEEEAFKSRPYVVEWPYMRFYAAVPITNPGGHVLGSYCIVDDKLRSDFGDTEIESMQDIADAIAQHLETVRLSHCHRRTETLVKTLTTFVKEQDDFDPAESFQDTPTQRDVARDAGDDQEGHATPSEDDCDEVDLGPCSPSDVTGELSSLFSKVAGSEPTESSFPFRNCEGTISASSLNEDRRNSLPQNVTSTATGPSNDAQSSAAEIANKIAKIFKRASVLLRDSMDLDGVLFIDASRCNAGVVLQNDTGTWEPFPSTLHPGFTTDPYPSPMDVPGVGSLSMTCGKPCDVLGFATKEAVDGSGISRHIKITERLLDELMTSLPQGHIFDLSDVMAHEGSSKFLDPLKELCRQLALTFPGANSVLFSPIGDWNKSRWLAGTLVWSSDVFRSLGDDDLHYFKAFGDSIISEVARLDWSTTQKAKSAFMSSVSHEMRSPLHGILASAELLATSSLPPEQQYMVDMIEACGMTLLDTLNHLLDFSGINNLSALEDSATGPSEGAMASLESAFDLGELVEEVVQVQYTGQTPPKAAVHLNQAMSPPPEDEYPNSDELSVIVRVEDRPTWTIHSVPGAWRRIIMNLLGNSLKWTKAGFVEVSLSKVNRNNNSTALALLSVTDTGAGIAPDFLRHDVFSPFTQENALSEGLGLGLSTVRQLVTSLDGHLNVQSEIGVGTQVDVFIPIQILNPPSTVPSALSLPHHITAKRPPVRVCLIGFNDYPGLKETPTGILPAEAKRKLAIRSCLTSILTERTEWKISSSETFDESEGDVAVIEETMFQEILNCRQRSQADGLYTGFKKIFVILNGKAPGSLPDDGLHLIRVSQPFGCRKFRDAVTKVDNLLQKPLPESLSHPISKVPLPNASLRSTNSLALKPIVPVMRETAVVEKPPSDTAASEPTQSQGAKPPHILIVDDNQINLKILATFATKIGCTFDTASDGLLALQRYQDSPVRYDLVLMDISMPVMDGIVSTTKIRQFEEEKGLQRSRIMAVTGVASTDMQQRAQAAGIDEYLVKPVSLAALKKAIIVV